MTYFELVNPAPTLEAVYLDRLREEKNTDEYFPLIITWRFRLWNVLK